MRKLIISFFLAVMVCTYVNAGNTDVSNIENVVYITPFAVSSGAQTSLSIQMKNTAQIRSFQFDLYLPDGISAVKSSKGRIQGTLNQNRLPDEDQHLLTFSEQPDGAIRFLCGSEYDENFTGSDGEIATLLIDVSVDMSVGDYPVYIRNITLSETDIKNHYDTELVESTITIGEPDDGRLKFYETSTTFPTYITGEKANVTMYRTIKANEWSTICLPFAMTEAQVKAAFGNDVQLADFTGCEPTYDEAEENIVALKVNFADVAAIEANHPYIIKVSAALSEFTVDGVDISPSEELSVDRDEDKYKRNGKWYYDYNSFIGTYVAGTEIPETALFLSENKFWYSTGKTKSKGFRGYFSFYQILSEVANAEARISLCFDDSDATGISNALRQMNNERVNKEVYDLTGRKVNNPQRKGLYVKDGKKVVVNK